MNAQPQNHVVDVEQLQLTQILRALTLAQLISILSLVMALVGATFTLGMYAEKVNSPRAAMSPSMAQLDAKATELNSRIHDLQSGMDEVAAANKELKTKLETSESQLANTRAKETFLGLSATTMFHAMVLGENLYARNSRVDRQESAIRLDESKAKYQETVDRLTEEGTAIGSVPISRGYEPKTFRFAHDGSTWVLPDFIR